MRYSSVPLFLRTSAVLALMLSAGLLLTGCVSRPGEPTRLRAPGDNLTRMVNEIGVWETEAAARRATSSLSSASSADWQQMACMVRPGTKAQVVGRQGDIAKVDVYVGLAVSCSGYVKAEFLSQD